MATIIDIRTRERLGGEVPAKFEILGWNDPVLLGVIPDKNARVLVDGLVPLSLALRLQSMCEEFNIAVAR
jgi:hypothetical protein